MKLTAKKAFSWAHRGCEIEHFEAGQTIETEDEDLIKVSLAEGWTDGDGRKGNRPQEDKARQAAPENK